MRQQGDGQPVPCWRSRFCSRMSQAILKRTPYGRNQDKTPEGLYPDLRRVD